MSDTKERILDTAERLFSENGYGATSLRSIIAAAGVNLAAVHYHFHSKEALLEAVIRRRAQPANAERLTLLEHFELEAAPNPAPIEKVIEAFLAPSFGIANDPGRGGMVFMRLLGRIHAEGDLLAGIFMAHFGDVLERFSTALMRALPELPPEELLWRLNFAVGAMSQALRGGSKDLRVISALAAPFDPQAVLQRLVIFLSAGFRAPLGSARSVDGAAQCAATESLLPRWETGD